MCEEAGIFAERRLYLRSANQTREVLVQLGPVTKTEDASSCSYRLIGFDQPIRREIWGIDDIQAIQLALALVGAELDRLGADGKYGLENDSDGAVGHGFQSLIV